MEVTREMFCFLKHPNTAQIYAFMQNKEKEMFQEVCVQHVSAMRIKTTDKK